MTSARQRILQLRVLRRFARDDPFVILRVLAPLESAISGVDPTRFRGLVPAADEIAAELCLRQHLFHQLQTAPRKVSLVRHLGSLDRRAVLPIPRAWRETLRSRGIKVDPLRSTLLLYHLSLTRVVAGLRRYVRALVSREVFPAAPSRPYAVAVGLTPDLAPSHGGRGFAAWAHTWCRTNLGSERLWAHVPGVSRSDGTIVTVAKPFPRLAGGGGSYAVFALRGAGIILRAGLGALFGRWWLGVMLPELLDLAYVQSLCATKLASAYVFHASEPVVRPLWTYFAEREGARVIMVYYSVNGLLFKPGDPPRPRLGTGEGIASWPEYIVMSADQAEGLRALRGEIPIIHVDPAITLVDGPTPMPTLPHRPAVAVFDVTPWRSLALADRGIVPSPFYRPDQPLRFLRDLAWAADRLGMMLVFKPKREIRPFEHRGFARTRDRIVRNGVAVILDPAISPTRVIERCDAVVSFPFTSPAVTAAALGKPSVYYDPAGWLGEMLTSLHGVQLITGRDALVQWLQDHAGIRPRNA